MKKVIITLVLLSSQSFAALPPKYQNEKDLEVMVDFTLNHSKVISNLKKIDLEAKTIYFDTECYAVFGRKHSKKPEGWVGPADPLEFKKSN